MIKNVKDAWIYISYDHDQVLLCFAVEPLRSKMTFRLQEPEAPFQNATSRDCQKAFNPQRELGAFCSGVNDYHLKFCIFVTEKYSL